MLLKNKLHSKYLDDICLSESDKLIIIDYYRYRLKSGEISRNLAQFLIKNYKIAEQEVENLIEGIEFTEPVELKWYMYNTGWLY